MSWPPPKPEDHEMSQPCASGPSIRVSNRYLPNPRGQFAGGPAECRDAADWAERQIGEGA